MPDDHSNRSLRKAIIAADNVGLGEAYRLFSNSATVTDRIKRFNSLESEVLYPPIHRPERFRSGPYGDAVVSVCRIEHHKRPHLLVEAMQHTKTSVRLHLFGKSMHPEYVDKMREMATEMGVSDRVRIEHRWISEDEKVDCLETALASAYIPLDEDSYGYPTIEAAHAQRCTITVNGSGGVLEFVEDGVCGFVTEAQPAAIAQAMDRLFANRSLAQRMGAAARARISALGIDWDTVVEKLLA